MSDFEYWRLCEELTVVQAALLIAGYDPSSYEGTVENTIGPKQPTGYAACRQAVISAISTGRLDGCLHQDEWTDLNGEVRKSLDLHRSTIRVAGIGEWLREKGMRSGFFFPENELPREYLDPEHERYAPKLAAAVRAWAAAGEDKTLKGTPKQRVEKWLRLHASEYGLTQKDGKPNESAIEAIARIANWKPEGGAPATQVASASNADPDPKSGANVVKLKRPFHTKSSPAFELDDEIPF